MSLFKTTNYSINTDIEPRVIHSFSNIQNIFDILHISYKNKLPCIISDKTLQQIQYSDDLTIIYKARCYHINWKNFFSINQFFKDNFTTSSKFSITNSMFNIFLLSFIDHNKKLISLKDKHLIGNYNSIFGIFNTYNPIIVKCKYKLYFSFNKFAFILYQVQKYDNYIVGKLFPDVQITNNNLVVYGNKYPIPKAFFKFKNNTYTIKSNPIAILNDKTINNVQIKDDRYNELCNLKNINSLYQIDINYILDKYSIDKLIAFIFSSLPQLSDYNNQYDNEHNEEMVKHNSGHDFKDVPATQYSLNNKKIQIYVVETNRSQRLNILLPYQYNIFMDEIINLCNHYIKCIKKDRPLYTKQKIIKFKNIDNRIHIVSEIYYTIIFIVIFLPKLLYNLKKNSKTDYIHVNYKFTNDEVKTLYGCKSESFITNDIYLISIIIKTLTTCIKNYYCIIQCNQTVNILPIINEMSNETILNWYDRSIKARLGNGFLLSLLSNMCIKLNNHYELPMVYLNIGYIDSENTIEIDKVYNTIYEQQIPIIINILYNNTNLLHISISYKKEYEIFKTNFQTIIDELLK